MQHQSFFYKAICYILLLSSFFSCNGNKKNSTEQNSFCYWKTTFEFTNDDRALWDTTGANHMYIRYFDVGWDKLNKEARPISSLKKGDTLVFFPPFITPSIFFTNDVFRYSTNEQLDTLSTRLIKRIEQINRIFNNENATAKYSEILIDCDWSANTKDKFFYFIEKLKNSIPDKDIITTLRLWQYKHQGQAGIPPVKKILLMCYNINAANNYDIKNSIVNTDEVKKYIQGVNYPLKIDLALPLFSWGVLFRNKEFKGIIRDAITDDYINNPDLYEKISDNRFRLKEEMIIGDFFARPGDEIRIEMVSPEELTQLANYLLSEIKTDQDSRITLFSWSNRYYIKRYTDEIKNIFSLNHR